MRHTPSSEPCIAPHHTAGSVLILVILAIVFLGALAAGVVSFLGTANMDTTVSNQSEKVNYNAESGFRYISEQYYLQGDDNGDGNEDDDKAQLLIDLNGATVNLPGNLGSFTLDIRPYWFITTAAYSAASTITVQVPGSFPDGYTLPSSGTLDLEDNSLHSYTSYSRNDPNVTFNLSTPVTLAKGKSVYMTVQPTGSQSVAKGGSLTLSSSTGSIFPDRYGQIQVYGSSTAVRYDKATYNAASGVLTLSDLSDALNVSAGDSVVLKKSAFVKSSGKAGTGGFTSVNEVKYNTTWTDSTASGTGPQSQQNADTSEMNSMTNWTDSGNGFTTGSYSSSDGTTETYVVTKQVDVDNDPDSPCTSGAHNNPNPTHIRYSTLFWNKNSLLSSIWQNATSDHLLSYDVQVKTAWGYQLDYGAGGISFRLHESSTAGKYNTIGLSFMKFEYKNSCQVPQGWGDEIPDAIKPTPDSNPLHVENLADKCLLVLWKQEVSGGEEHRDWIAYKDLSGDLCVNGMQKDIDGQCVTDDSTLMVRLVEMMVNGTKTSDITVYYGDASNPANPGWWEHSGWHWIYHNGGCSPRTPNAIPYDSGTLRQVYFKNSTYAVNSPFPTFPPLSLSSWNSTYDYFTFVENGRGNPVACSLCDWDRVNPTESTAFQLQNDGGTLRTTTFLSPSSGTFPSNRAEIGLHSFGGGSANTAIGFKDFSIEFLIAGSARSGSLSGAIMR